MASLIALILTLMATSTVTACAEQGQSAAPPPLEGTSWILAEVRSNGSLTPAVDSSGSLSFAADATMSGSTGCNRFSGTWAADGSALTLTPGPMTLMACQEAQGAQESAVIAALSATAAYSVTDGDLRLLDASGEAVAKYSTAVVELAGTSWRATGVNNGKGAVVTTATTSSLTLLFGAADVSGFDGCGSFSGAYTASGGTISITDLAGQEQCDPTYFAALKAATAYRIDGNRLELRDGAGALQAGFTAAA